MQVREGMSSLVLTIGPQHTIRDAAARMTERNVGAAVVVDEEQPGPGIITERDILQVIGQGQNPDTECVCDHLAPRVTFAAPDWSLERAAEVMVKEGFRHLVVVDDGEIAGVLSMRDIVRCWVNAGVAANAPA